MINRIKAMVLGSIDRLKDTQPSAASDESRGTHTAVLIVGAGRTGLAPALWLTRLGMSVRIIDKAAEPGTTSRALGVQARTLEFYPQVDIAAPVCSCWRHGCAPQPLG